MEILPLCTKDVKKISKKTTDQPAIFQIYQKYLKNASLNKMSHLSENIFSKYQWQCSLAMLEKSKTFGYLDRELFIANYGFSLTALKQQRKRSYRIVVG